MNEIMVRVTGDFLETTGAFVLPRKQKVDKCVKKLAKKGYGITTYYKLTDEVVELTVGINEATKIMKTMIKCGAWRVIVKTVD